MARFLLSLLPYADAHMSMIKPATWHDPEGRFTTSADPRFDYRAAGCTGEQPAEGEEDNVGCISQWYTNFTFIPGNATILDGSPLLTYPGKLARKGTQQNPWRAPGTAPLKSPCGFDGGNPDGCPAGNPAKNGCAGGGYGHGPDARTLPGNAKPTEWSVGSQVEAEFGITANHGGGYQYRLCPKPSSGSYLDLTEECFQQLPLGFVGDTQWIQLGGNESERREFPAMRTREGTFPKGSQWTKNPIPACGTIEGGAFTMQYGLCLGSQFAPPLPGIKGFYGFTQVDAKASPLHELSKLSQVRVVDKLQLPADLPLGDYVLSFRIDCEQTPQVWNQCADIRIVAAELSV